MNKKDINPDRFHLTRIDRNRYAVADTETNYTIVFRAGDFNGSQKVIPPEQQPADAKEAARLGAYAMRCIGDYMAEFHADLIFSTPEQEERKQRFYNTLADIGQAVRELREHKGRTIEEAAELSSFSVKRIAAIESGKLPADINVITRIVERLGGRLAIIPQESPDDPHCQFIELED